MKFRERKDDISPFFLGFFEKRKRKELGYSLENVSKDLFMSKGNLSEMENGIRMMKKDVFNRFLRQYDIQFDTELNCFFEMKEILAQIVDCFLRFDDRKQEKVREHFEAMEGSWKNTYGCFVGELIQYFIQVVMDHQKSDDLFRSLVLIENCLSNDEKALLYMVRGMEGRWNIRLGNMETFFEKALEFVDKKELFGLEALIEYYQIVEWMRSGSSFEVYEHCVQVRKKFYASHNYIRALYLDNLEAVGITCLRAYSSAYARFEALLSNMEYVDDPYLRFCVVQNAILVLCVMKKYREALELMEKEKATFSCGLSNFIFAPYCFYMLNEGENVRRTLKEIKPYVKDESDRLVLKMVEYALEKNCDAFFESARRLLAFDQKYRNQENIELTYQFMIHFCKEMGMVQKRIEIQEAYIAFLTNG
ncbi:hypothetical protein C815_01380 [Firmicutes bacterium M10-2]|nr:hypothetical protein C815_01380 [Firmicutes bacterium M10-2]